MEFLMGFATNASSMILFDISKLILKNNLGKDYFKVIKKTISNTIPYECDELITDIAERLCFKTKLKKQQVFEDVICCFEKSFNDFEQYNLNARELAIIFLNKFPNELIKSKELYSLISFNLLKETFNTLSELSSNYNNIYELFKNQNKHNAETQKLVIELFNKISNQADKEVQHQSNARYIPQSFIPYFERSLFLERFIFDYPHATLRDLYIEPKYKVLDFPYKNSYKKYENIIKLINNFWRNNLKIDNYNTKYAYDTKHINTLFIKGQAGSGKTSLFYHLAYKKSVDSSFLPDVKVYFIKLIELLKNNNNSLSEDNPLQDILNELNVTKTDLKNTILLLDGLDEICTLKNFQINDYCNNLISSLTKISKCKIIITVRLNYINITHNSNKNTFNVELLSFDEKDVRLWIDRYFKIHQKRDDLKTIALNNITKSSIMYMDILTVPLLLYMIVALGIKLSSINSLAELYEKVFNELLERTYNESEDSDTQQHNINKVISPKLSRLIAREIAYTMYIKDTLLLPIDGNLRDNLEAAYNIFEENTLNKLDGKAKRNTEKLFPITFYYKDINDVVEFAHKSIMEFLSGEKIAESIVNCKSTRDIFNIINEQMIKKYISVEVFGYCIFHLKRIFNEKGGDIKQLIEETFFEYINNGNIFRANNYEQIGFDSNKIIFKIFWVLLNEFCDYKNFNEVYKNEDIKRSISIFFTPFTFELIPFLVNEALPFNLPNVNLFNYRFCGSSFVESKIDNGKIMNTNFESTNMTECFITKVSFSNAFFNSVEYRESVLRSCDINDSVFIGCNFNRARFYFTNINNCKIENVGFNRVTFKDCNFINIRFVNSNFTNCTIDGGSMIEIENLSDIAFKGKNIIRNIEISCNQLEYIFNEKIEIENPIIHIIPNKDIEKIFKENFNRSSQTMSFESQELILKIILKEMINGELLKEETDKITIKMEGIEPLDKEEIFSTSILSLSDIEF